MLPGMRYLSCARIRTVANCFLWCIDRFAHLGAQFCAEWLSS
jgi:hypothetical protein